ncbi:24331_t:CDS:2 [Gigaspora margarita]|uniref:24331_t:CDS:1 n=1 Tax=Gigaspora margarita TaxID=4874 RepID=A0ABN7UNR7_GIGMA|nr:24331_t:CDS:2 [Gigaspora margarita]
MAILNKETKDKLDICKICKTEFSTSISTSTLADYLNIHNIVVRWIICNLQPFNIIEEEE